MTTCDHTTCSWVRTEAELNPVHFSVRLVMRANNLIFIHETRVLILSEIKSPKI